MGKFFLNSVIITALSLVLLLVIALPAAYALSRFDFKGKKFLNIAFMAGLFVNVNYIVVPIFLMLSGANRMLGVEFFLDNRFILSLVYASSSLSFSIYLLSGYFKTLPMGYEEAAYIDGCGYFKTMVKIMIPMAKPSIITVILFQFLSFWNEYIIAFTLMDENSTLAVGTEKPDGSGENSYQLRYHVCRSCDRYDPGTDPVCMRTETADQGYDAWRTERLGGEENE